MSDFCVFATIAVAAVFCILAIWVVLCAFSTKNQQDVYREYRRQHDHRDYDH